MYVLLKYAHTFTYLRIQDILNTVCHHNHRIGDAIMTVTKYYTFIKNLFRYIYLHLTAQMPTFCLHIKYNLLIILKLKLRTNTLM